MLHEGEWLKRIFTWFVYLRLKLHIRVLQVSVVHITRPIDSPPLKANQEEIVQCLVWSGGTTSLHYIHKLHHVITGLQTEKPASMFIRTTYNLEISNRLGKTWSCPLSEVSITATFKRSRLDVELLNTSNTIEQCFCEEVLGFCSDPESEFIMNQKM